MTRKDQRKQGRILAVLAVAFAIWCIATEPEANAQPLTRAQAHRAAWDFEIQTFYPEYVRSFPCVRRTPARGWSCTFLGSYGETGTLEWRTTLWVWKVGHRVYVWEAGVPGG